VNSLGLAAGLATAALWAVTALCFEAASRRVGSLVVNVLRLIVAQILFIGLSLARTGHAMPHLSGGAWLTLSVSGLVGFVAGDLMLFRAFVLIGARLSMLVYASVPVMTALAGYLFLGERIGSRALLGMAVTMAGIALAVTGKRQGPDPGKTGSRRWGVLFALGGSAGQTAGLLLAKYGSAGLSSFDATQVRVLAGLAGFLILAAGAGHLRSLVDVLRRGLLSTTDPSLQVQHASARTALFSLSLGAFFGPFLGVSLGLLSAQLLAAGVASTLMSLVPVLLIPMSILIFRERASLAEIAGTIVSFGGVVLLTS
jgi:drug/metabolite transporter (DMT)-like permease